MAGLFVFLRRSTERSDGVWDHRIRRAACKPLLLQGLERLEYRP
jgi:hypothetical protein